jgi:hypothetical protein
MAEPSPSSSNDDAPVADSPLTLAPARTLSRFREEPIGDEIDRTAEAPITEPQPPSSNGAKPAPDSLVTLDQRKELLNATLEQKVGQGYQIESQTDTDAVLVTKGRRRWFGMLGGTAETRQSTSIDEQGRTKTRRL